MDYNEIVAGLKSSQVQDYQPDPVLTEKVNDAAIFGKNFLGATGGMLEGEAIKKTFKQLSKQGSEGLLKQLDLSDEDMEDLISKVSSGDTEGVASMIAEKGINVARNKIGGFVRDTKGSARKLYQSLKAKATGRSEPVEDSGEPASAGELSADPQIAETAFPTEISTQIPEGAGSVQGQALEQALQGGRGLSEEEAKQFTEDPSPESADISPETDITNNTEMVSNTMKQVGSQRAADAETDTAGEDALGDIGGGGDAGADASQIGSKVVKGLDELTVDSEAFDESPIGIGVTALLGVASLVGGIFVKTHKDSFTRPPMPHQVATSFAVERGVF